MKISRDSPVVHNTTAAENALNISGDSMVAILSDNFTVVHEDGRPDKAASVRLTDNYLSYRLVKFTQHGGPDEQCDNNNGLIQIAIKDVIGCHVMKSSPAVKHVADDELEVNKQQKTSFLCLYAYPARSRSRLGLIRQQKRGRKTIVFAVNKHDTWAENFEIAETWRSSILWLMYDKTRIVQTTPTLTINIPTDSPRLRNLLILINPASGPGKALEIFEQRVAPILAESGLKFEVMITKGAGNASNFIKSVPDLLVKWDGIVIVSGDGLMYEVVNGLMQRDDNIDSIKIPLGIIPGGSGNGLAHAVNYAVGDKVTCSAILASSLNVARGKILPMDLIKVTTAKETLYSFLSVGWGLVADIDIESERLRMIGGARFTVWAIVRTLSLRKYRGKLSYLPLTGYEHAHELKTKSDRGKLLACKSIDEGNGQDENVFRPRTQSAPFINGNFISRNTEENASCSTGENLRNALRNAELIPKLDEPIGSNWVTIDDEFVVVYSGHQTHLSSDCFFAPQAKLDDGIIWLLFIRGDATRAQVLHFLTALDAGSHINLPYVYLVPVHAFRLEPHSTDGRITIDGELIDCGPIQAEVLPSIARIMSR